MWFYIYIIPLNTDIYYAFVNLQRYFYFLNNQKFVFLNRKSALSISYKIIHLGAKVRVSEGCRYTYYFFTILFSLFSGTPCMCGKHGMGFRKTFRLSAFRECIAVPYIMFCLCLLHQVPTWNIHRGNISTVCTFTFPCKAELPVPFT